LRIWLKAVACQNIAYMLVTAPVSQELRFWLKADATPQENRNIDSMVITALVFQESMSLSNVALSLKRLPISVIWDTSQEFMTLKSPAAIALSSAALIA